MTLSNSLVSKFHQTGVSSAVKRTPILSKVARAWWHRTQAAEFRRTLKGVSAPIFPAPSDWSPGKVTVPPRRNVEQRDPALVTAGDAFTEEMSTWCSTSKFKSLGYQDIYASVLVHLRDRSPRVLEVGIGVNDPTAPSGMNTGHEMGSSLRGWAHYLPGSEVHGADVDQRTLVDTDQYSTHFVDQRDFASLVKVRDELAGPLDLAIDDGLHTPEANAKTVSALLPALAPDGVLVVEDLLPEFDYLWDELPNWLNTDYSVTFYPSQTLRQDRVRGSECGMAVFTRRR